MGKLTLILIGISVFYCTDCVDLPRFVGHGSNVTVIVGRDAAITCRVDSLHTYKVAWLRVDTQTILTISGHVITKHHRMAVTHGDGSWTLIIRAVEPGDAGQYMCQVNTEPMMTQLHSLQVVVPPDINDEVCSSEVLVKEGENASMCCVASGAPAPVIAWRREDSKHFRVDNQTRVSKWTGQWVNMSDVDRTASGPYLCIASNGVPPSVSKRVQLNVMFAPKVWSGRTAIRALSGTDVTLECLAEAFPAPSIYWTLNGEQRLDNGTKHLISSSSRGYSISLLLTVQEMRRSDAGAYRCHVENSMGRAQAELYLHLLTTTSTTTTTTTTTTSTTTSTLPPPTVTSPSVTDHNNIENHQKNQDQETLESASLEGSEPDNPYIVLSQHQLQNIDLVSSI